MQVFPVEARARCVDKLGWHDDVFVTASQVIGQSKEKIVFQNAHAIESAIASSGSVEDWQNAIGRLASGNSRLMFAISTAFAPTLARLVGEDSGGFHFRGTSSSGKSTALKVAASVWGKPEAYCRLWRATTNGLEGLAALHNDGLLILDELSQVDPKEAGEVAYLLANGQGKTRASRVGTAKQSARWSLFFLSAGEESLSALMAKAGQRANAGQEIRLADIEADAGAGMGLFETIHDLASPSAMALSLQASASQYYGTVGMAWLEQVVMHRQSIISAVSGLSKQFIDRVVGSEATGQTIRVAKRFALVAIAGELATQFGLTGWQKGESIKVAQTCFRAWQENFGADGNREDRALMLQVRAFFESHGASRFDKLRDPNGEKIKNRAGFYVTDDNGDRIYMVLAEVFRNELCKGFDHRTAIKALLKTGWLTPAPDGKSSHKPRVRGLGIPRLYVFTHKVWGGE